MHWPGRIRLRKPPSSAGKYKREISFSPIGLAFRLPILRDSVQQCLDRGAGEGRGCLACWPRPASPVSCATPSAPGRGAATLPC